MKYLILIPLLVLTSCYIKPEQEERCTTYVRIMNKFGAVDTLVIESVKNPRVILVNGELNFTHHVGNGEYIVSPVASGITSYKILK